MPNANIIVVQGPTASGKTALSIALAKYFNTEIISFDSRQFYADLQIGVARPTLDELNQVKHHFIADQSVHKPLNAAEFSMRAKPILTHLLNKNGVAVLVGGSGMFADALLLGLDQIPHDQEVHQKWKKVFKSNGILALQAELEKVDPDFYQLIDKQNPTRLIRALEVVELTGQSNMNLRKGAKKDPANLARITIEWPRDELYERIDARVNQMCSMGLKEEAARFYPSQIQLQALQTVGYSEFFDFFAGRCSEEQAIEKIKQHTRNYAKRQLTWLRRYEKIHRLDPKSDVSLFEQALSKIG
jgi:tRNA dimethylallyltransferase